MPPMLFLHLAYGSRTYSVGYDPTGLSLSHSPLVPHLINPEVGVHMLVQMGKTPRRTAELPLLRAAMGY